MTAKVLRYLAVAALFWAAVYTVTAAAGLPEATLKAALSVAFALMFWAFSFLASGMQGRR